MSKLYSASIFNKNPPRVIVGNKSKYLDLENVTIYNEYGESVLGYNKNAVYYSSETNEQLNMCLWVRSEHYKYEYNPKSKPSKDSYFLGVNKKGDESIVYKKDNEYYTYATDIPFDLFIWRDITNLKDFRIKS